MKIEEYRQLDGIGLAQLIKKRELAPQEALRLALEQAYKVNPKINAIVTFLEDEARGMMNQLEKKYDKAESMPFFGVPFLLKDLLADLKGTPISQGSAVYKNEISTENAELTDHYINMGLVIFGKTNLPEFGIMGTTEPKALGVCRNPWNSDLSTGGSSGGSAAAVAAGIVPFAAGGDGGGSIRIPASCCGLFGLKPTRGRTSNGPGYGELWEGATVQHVISRTVRDSAHALDHSWKVNSAAPYKIEAPGLLYADQAKTKAPRMRIAFSTKHPLGNKMGEDAVKAIEESVKILKGLGHEVIEDAPAIDGKELARSYITMVIGQISAQVEELKKIKGSSAVSQLELSTRALHLVGKSVSAGHYVQERNKWHKYSRAYFDFLQKYDLALTPTMARRPTKIGELDLKLHETIGMTTAIALGLGKPLVAMGIVNQLAYQSLDVVPFTQLANLTGLPAMSVPLYWSPDNIPMGSHFTAGWGREDKLFSLAFELEEAKPWKNKIPALS